MKVPNLGESLPATHPSEDTLSLLRLRRSTPADFLEAPGPDATALSDMLTIAARVPDHRRVTPFRFVVFQDEARTRFGEVLEKAFIANEPGAEEARIAIERNRFQRAPVVVAVISSVNREHRTPEWEQILSAGAACQNLLLAAAAHGFAAQWITEWYAYDAHVGEALMLKDSERIAGFVYIGTAREEPKERGRPDLASITQYY
ncbi:MAG: nitroreductase [Pseudomonadota bacterium]